MSTNLKNYIIETKNNLKYLIKADIYTVTENGILTFQTDNKSVASYDAGSWLSCYELTEPSIIYLYSSDIQSYNKETSQEVIKPLEHYNNEENNDILNETNNNEKIIDTDLINDNNIVEQKDDLNNTIETIDLKSQEEISHSNLTFDEKEKLEDKVENQNILSFLPKEDESKPSTINVRERVIDQLNNIYLTPSERKLKEQKEEEEDTLAEFYKDIGRKPLSSSNKFEEINQDIEETSSNSDNDDNKDIEETSSNSDNDDNKDIEETSSNSDNDDNKDIEETSSNSDNDDNKSEIKYIKAKLENSEDETEEKDNHDQSVFDEEFLETLLQTQTIEPNKEISYFDDEPMSALLSTDFTVKNIDNVDQLSELDDMVDSQNDNVDPLSALDDMVDNQNDNVDPLSALDDMVDSQNDNVDPLAALDDMVDSQNDNVDPLAALDDMVDSQNDNVDPLAALDDMVDSQNDNVDPLSALDDMVDSQNLKTKEYEAIDNFDKDEHIDEEENFEENKEADVYYENNNSESLDELLSKLPNDDKKFEASYHDSSREIRRVPSSQKDLDNLNNLIDNKSKKAKEVLTSEFRDTPEAIEVKKPSESYQLRNSQGRLLTPQELKIKKEKIIEQTVFQYCSKFPKFNSKHLSEILSKNPKAIAYKIVEEDIIWVASKMIRASSIEAKYFIREQEQKKLSHFLPTIIGKHWDGSISNLSSIIKDIPQLSSSNLMDLSVWLLENSHL